MPAGIAALARQKAEKDTVVAACVAGAPDIAALRVAGDRTVTLPIHHASNRHVVFFVDVAPHSSLTVYEVFGSAIIDDSASARAENKQGNIGNPSEASWASVLILVSVGAGARVQWFGQSVRAPGFTFLERLAVLAQDAVLEQHSALVAANAVRENIHVALNAPGATARVRSLFVGNATHQFDLGVTAEHRAPHTVSDLRAKGVLGGRAQGVYHGLVRVEKNARGSDGYQRCDALLLSRTAEADPIPNLEIETNDVRCTHGVTVSHLDTDQLFYLQSRGLSDTVARDVLVDGFTGAMLRSFPEQQRGELQRAAQNALREQP